MLEGMYRFINIVSDVHTLYIYVQSNENSLRFFRRIICGLTAFSTKQHIVRAALESVCFQTRDILEAMHKDCGFPLTKLHTDGKMSTNNLLMQLQADLSGIPVCKYTHELNSPKWKWNYVLTRLCHNSQIQHAGHHGVRSSNGCR